MTSKEKINSIKSVINEFYHDMNCKGNLTECANECWKEYQQFCEDIKQDLDRFEKLNNIFGDSHISEIKAKFKEIKCNSDLCDSCPLCIGDDICLKKTFERRWKVLEENEKLEQENASLHNKIEILQSENLTFKKIIKEKSKLEKELKQTKLNFKNSQIHSKNAYKRLKEKYDKLEERHKECYARNFEVIIENTKLKKVIEILKDKIEFEDLGEMQSGNMYRGYFNDCLDEEEVKSVKEVFGNE